MCTNHIANTLYLVDVEDGVTIVFTRRQGRVAALRPLWTPRGELCDPCPSAHTQYHISRVVSHYRTMLNLTPPPRVLCPPDSTQPVL